MEYEEAILPTEEELERLLQVSNSESLDDLRRRVPLIVEMSDASVAAKWLIRLMEHPDKWVAGSAVLGISELIRFGLISDLVEIKSLKDLLLDTAKRRKDIIGNIEAACDDLGLLLN